MSTQNLSRLELAAEEIDQGINFEKNLAYLNEEGEKGNIFALKTLGFLYSLGLYDSQDESKKLLIDNRSEESEKKAREYFTKAAELGSVHAKIWLAMGECIRVALDDKSDSEAGENFPTAQDFLNAEKLALHAIEESKKESCDCTQNAVAMMCHWLAQVYDSKNPSNPIYDEEKVKYWEEEYEKKLKNFNNFSQF